MGCSSRFLRRSFFAVLLLAGVAHPAAATNIAWKNAVSGSWNIATNWMPAQVPGPSDVALITLGGNYTVSINSNASVGAVALSGGTGTRRLNVNGATLTTSTGIAVGGTNILSLNSGTLSGTGTIDVTGTLMSSGNSAINTPVLTHAATTFSVAGDSLKVSGSFENQGTLQLSAATPAYLFVTGTLTNAASGTILVSSLGGGFHGYLKGTLDNRGTVSLGGEFTLESSSAQHQNTGSISIAGADLTIRQSGTSPSFVSTAGILFINAGRTLHADGGTLTVVGGSVNGNGRLLLTNGAEADFSVVPDISALEMQNATGSFPGTFDTNDTDIDLQNSVLTANITNAAGHTIPVVGSTLQGTIINIGTLDIQGASSLLAFLDNEGLVTIDDGLLLASGSTGQLNNGTIRVFGGTFAIAQTSGGFFSNANTLEVFAGAMVQVTGGDFHNTVDGFLKGSGGFDVSGTTFLNDGTISPGSSPGVITISGDVTFGPLSYLDMQIGGLNPGTGYDQIQISGNVALNGTLSLSTISGFIPEPGNMFDVITCGSHSGQFSLVNGMVSAGTVLAFVPQTRPADPIRLTAVEQFWQNVPASGTPPAARTRHVSAYDGFSNRLIVFGGFGFSGELNDTWVLTHANGSGGAPVWQPLTIAPPLPPARQGHAAAYDALNNRLIVYGGYSSAMISGYTDVWVLSHANGLGGTPAWTQLAPGGGTPGARVGGGAGYSPATNRLILFGGVPPVNPCPASNDIWVLANANGLGGSPAWSVLTTNGVPPSARSGAVVAYDEGADRLIVQGGTEACGGASGEARYLTHASGVGGTPAWTSLSLLDPAAPGRQEHAGIFDAMTDRLVTFGGLASNGTTELDDVMLVTDATNAGSAGWCVLQPPVTHPANRFGHTSSWDPSTRRMIVYGGDSDDGLRGDAWTLFLDLEPGQVSGVGDPLPPAPLPKPGVASSFGFHRAPWPNPTSDGTSMVFRLPSDGHVTLDIFNVRGQFVAQIFAGDASEGLHEVVWNGKGRDGGVPSGIYYVVLRSGTAVDTRRVVVAR